MHPSLSALCTAHCAHYPPPVVCTIHPPSCALSTPHRMHYAPLIVCTMHPSLCTVCTPHRMHDAPLTVCTMHPSSYALCTPRCVHDAPLIVCTMHPSSFALLPTRCSVRSAVAPRALPHPPFLPSLSTLNRPDPHTSHHADPAREHTGARPLVQIHEDAWVSLPMGKEPKRPGGDHGKHSESGTFHTLHHEINR